MDYGHRGIYESDISRPRYHEQPAPLLSSLTHPPGRRLQPVPRTLWGYVTLPLWWQAGRAIRAREQWRHVIMAGFNRVRQNLLRLARALVENGTLPDVEVLWLLRVDEMRQLDDGWQPGTEFLRKRREQIKRLESYHLPDRIHRFDDLEPYREGTVQAVEQDHVSGISLTTGTVAGQAWVLKEPRTMLPEGFTPEATILVAQAVDAGWIPTFARVAGVIIETGGDLSHGSIILRELGIPAITNARHATRLFSTGDRVYLDAGHGQARPLANEDGSGE
jgi:pyruvate,water dikinase